LIVVLLAGVSAAGAADEAQSGVTVAQAGESSGAEEGTAQKPEPAAPESGSEPETTGGSQTSETGVEVLTVKGRGMGSIETEVPSSITQFDAGTIQALGAQNISDLSRVTPNVNIVQPGSTQATFFVRGIGLSDFSSNAAGAVTIFQDDVAINAPAIQTGQLYDVEGVEIVRGPQGTGPFRNASAGAIRVKSRRPSGNYEGQLRTTLAEYHADSEKGARDALIQDYEGVVGFPIVEGWLSSRFAFRLRDAAPYVSNGCGTVLPFAKRATIPRRPAQWAVDDPSYRMCGERDSVNSPFGGISQIPVDLPRYVNDQHNWAARGTFGLTPPDSELQIVGNLHGGRLDQDSTLGQNIGTKVQLQGSNTLFGGRASGGGYADRDILQEFEDLCRRPSPGAASCRNPLAGYELAKNIADRRSLDRSPYRGDYDIVGQTTRDSWGGFLSAESEISSDMKLFGLASLDGYERSQDTDTDFSPDSRIHIVQDDEAWQTYEEVRLSGELEQEPIEWTIGGYFLHEELDVPKNFVFLPGSTGASGVVELFRPYRQGLDSYAGWGEFSWDFADDFTLEGGVRYNYETKTFHFRTRNSIGGIVSAGEDVTSAQEETWQTPTGQIVLTYHIGSDVSAYARYARGFKAGHFNALATAGNVQEPPAKEEYNDSWETGLRGSWFSGRLALATSFFYYRYENYQVFLFVDSANATEPPVLEIINAQQAENYGIEIEGTSSPLRGLVPPLFDGLRVSANFSWLHGEYLDFSTIRNIPIQGETVPVQVDYSGKQLQNAPEYKVSGTVEWTFDFGRYGSLIPRYDINWTADAFFDPNEGHGSVDPTGRNELPDYAIGQSQFFLHNVRLAYRTPTGNVELAGWCRNVGDQTYKNFAFDASRFTGIVINFPGEPRTIGADLTFTF
jgi:iron complex outermembrane recepter protein